MAENSNFNNQNENSNDDQKGNGSVDFPENFLKLPVKLPPMLLGMAGYNGNARFVSVNYSFSKAGWSDGRGMQTFSYYAVYAPFINHPSINIYLRANQADLGSDDTEATHSLVLDRTDESIFLAPFSSALKFLSAQHPPVETVELTIEMIKELEERFRSASTDMKSMQRLGMFEFLGTAENRQAETAELIEFLNENTPSEVREAFAKFGITI